MRNSLSSSLASPVGDNTIVGPRFVGTHVLTVSGESLSTHLNPLDIKAFPWLKLPGHEEILGKSIVTSRPTSCKDIHVSRTETMIVETRDGNASVCISKLGRSRPNSALHTINSFSLLYVPFHTEVTTVFALRPDCIIDQKSKLLIEQGIVRDYRTTFILNSAPPCRYPEIHTHFTSIDTDHERT